MSREPSNPAPSADAARPAPRFSVIMNTYNGGPWIRQTIDSVRAQTFADWELLVWDDGSTDDTPAIAASYNDPRIRVFPTHDRAGLGQARDRVCRVATGQWLAFLDQDDWWEPEKLQAQADRIDAASASADGKGSPGICYTRALRFSSRGPLGDFDHHHAHTVPPEGDVFEDLFRYSCFICMSAVALERSAVLAALPIPEWVRFCPDYYLYLKIARTHAAIAVPRQLTHYRIHDKNMSIVHRMRIHHEIIRIVESWQQDLPPSLFKRRIQIHHTLVALDEVRAKELRRQGAARLVTKGSVRYLLERPFAKAYRLARRVVGGGKGGTQR